MIRGTERRVLALDGVRGSAILLVLIWHYGPCQILPSTTSTALLEVRHWFALTWSGVDLFFVLSGFLIGGILLDHRRQRGYFSTFYIRRACRILPVYLLVVGTFALFVFLLADHLYPFRWLVRGAMPLWSYATFTQNFWMSYHDAMGANWLGVTWSLAIEEQFYLCLPLAVYLLPRRVLVGALAVLVVAAPILRGFVSEVDGIVNPLYRADSLLLGVLIAAAVRNARCRAALEAHVGILHALLAAFVLGTGLLLYWPDALGSWDYTWLSGLYGTLLLIVVIDGDGRVARVFEHPILVRLGVLSYAVYMFHQIVSGLLHGWFRAKGPNVESPTGAVLTGAALILTLTLAALSHATLERWFLSLGRRWHYGAAPPAGRSS